MSAGSAATAGRAAAEAQMTDTFTARRPDPDNPTTDADGYTVPGWAAEGATLGKIPNKRTAGAAASTARTISVGGVDRVVIENGLHLPWSASPEVDWEYQLTTLGPDTHPSLLNKRWRVIETHPTSNMTAWRLDVVEVS